jgi:hypothetical protein
MFRVVNTVITSKLYYQEIRRLDYIDCFYGINTKKASSMEEAIHSLLKKNHFLVQMFIDYFL